MEHENGRSDPRPQAGELIVPPEMDAMADADSQAAREQQPTPLAQIHPAPRSLGLELASNQLAVWLRLYGDR